MGLSGDMWSSEVGDGQGTIQDMAPKVTEDMVDMVDMNLYSLQSLQSLQSLTMSVCGLVP